MRARTRQASRCSKCQDSLPSRASPETNGGCGLIRRAAQGHAHPVDVSLRAPKRFSNLIVRVTGVTHRSNGFSVLVTLTLHLGSASDAPLTARMGQTGANPLPDQLTLELGHRA